MANLQSLAGWILLLAGLVVLYVINDGYYMTVALVMMLWAVLAIGLNFILGYAGYFHLGLGAFYGLGAYGAAVLSTAYQMPMIVGLVVMPVVGAIASAIIGPLVLRTRDLHFAVATLALGMIVSDVTNNWVSVTGGPMGIGGIPRPGVVGLGPLSIDGRTLPGMFVMVSAIFVALMAAAAVARRSNFVLILRGIKSDDLMTRSLGFKTVYYKIIAFSIAGAIASLGGVLYAHIVQYISPEPFTFFAASFQAFVVLVVGGLGSLWGPVLGSILLTGLPEALDLDPHMKLVIYGAVLLAVTLLLPKGLASAGQVFAKYLRRQATAGTAESTKEIKA